MTTISSNDNQPPRPPISADLLAQAESIEVNGYVPDGDIASLDVYEWWNGVHLYTVTWRGRDAGEKGEG
jgi:hypothetical protein